MNPLNPHTHARMYVLLALASASLIALAALFWPGATLAARGASAARHARRAIPQYAGRRAYRSERRQIPRSP